MTDRLELGRLNSAADANSWQYHFVMPHTTADQFTIATGACGPQPLGVLQNDPQSGDAGRIMVVGPTKVYADATATAIGIRDLVTSGSDGQAVIAGGSAAHGIALEALASGNSVLITVMLYPVLSIIDNTP